MQITDITPVKPKSTKKIRLAAYARVSTKSEEQIHSFLAQIRYYNQFVKDHPEYELIEVYTDEGITGTEIVRRIFRDYLSGMGIYKIKDNLNEDLIPRRKKGVLWTRETVRYILRNSRYKGDALFLKQYITETLPHRQVQNKGEQPMYYVENSNVSIIDRNDFDKVQELFQKKKIEDRKKRASVFARKIICADCGGQMIRKFDCRRKRKTKWVCKNPACKKETFISDEETLARLTKIINGIISNPETIGDEQEKEKTSVNEFNYADKDVVVKNISKLYSAIDEKAAMSERVKDILKDMSPLIEFSAEVLFDIADEVQINENGMVSIKLINGQIVGG